MTSLVSLEINLSTPPYSSFYPGDVLSGNVSFQTFAEENLLAVSITFRGYSKVVYAAGQADIGRTGLQKSEDTVLFFETEKTLLQGPEFVPAGVVQDLPFEFAWAARTLTDFSGSRVGEEREAFDMRPHLMPPSLEYEEGTVSGGVFYELQAKLLRPGKEATLSRKDIFFNQYGVPVNTVQLGREMRSKTLVSTQPLSRQTPQKKRSLFKKNESAQKLQFTVSVEIPKTVYLGQVISVSVHLRPGKSESMAQLPPFYLQTARVYIISVTHWRFPNPSPQRPKAAYIRVTRESNLLSGLSNFQQEIEPGTSMELGDLLSLRIEDAPLPFRSYCISRSYSLGFHLAVKCGVDTASSATNIEIPISTLSQDLKRLATSSPSLTGCETIFSSRRTHR